MLHLNTSAELRRHSRCVVDGSELLTVEVPSADGAMHTGVILDISEGGLGVQLFRPLAKRDSCDLRLRLPASDAPLSTQSAVAWVAPSKRAGIRFIDPSSETSGQIREWIRNRPSPPRLQSGSRQQTNGNRTPLQFIAERARSVVDASGVAIAVGDKDLMECRASTGNAPDVGVLLQPGPGLSGSCLRTGSVVRCNESLSDERVDAVVAIRLDMRSAIVLPVRASGKLVGVLEVFSSHPNAFADSAAESQFGTLLQLLAVAIEEDSRAASEPQKEPPAETATQSSTGEEKTESTSARSVLTSLPGKISLAITAVALGLVLLGYVAQKGRESTQNISPPPAASVVPTVAVIPPTIRFVPSTLSERVGSSFSVDVVLNNAQNVSSVPLEVVHDPNKLQFVAVTIGALPGPSGVLVHREDRGTIHLTASRTTPTPGMTGNGVVCTLVFIARAPGKSQLSIGQAPLRDSAMRLITAEGSTATVTVRPRLVQNE